MAIGRAVVQKKSITKAKMVVERIYNGFKCKADVGFAAVDNFENDGSIEGKVLRSKENGG